MTRDLFAVLCLIAGLGLTLIWVAVCIGAFKLAEYIERKRTP